MTKSIETTAVIYDNKPLAPNQYVLNGKEVSRRKFLEAVELNNLTVKEI